MPAGQISRLAEEDAISAWLAEHKAITSMPRQPAAIKTAARRGRPEKAGSRYPSGDFRPVNDKGTDQVREKRTALVGADDDKRAATVLGVLYARRKLFAGDVSAGRRYSVGQRFAGLFARGFRNPLIIPTLLRDMVAAGAMTLATALLVEGGDEEAGTAARTDYLAAREAVERRGRHVIRAVERVCVYDEPPRSDRELECLRDGLDALHRHFEEADARSRAARDRAA